MDSRNRDMLQYVVFLLLFYFHLIINSRCNGSGLQTSGPFFQGWWWIIFSKFQRSAFLQRRISLKRNRWKKNCLRFLKQLTSICGWPTKLILFLLCFCFPFCKPVIVQLQTFVFCFQYSMNSVNSLCWEGKLHTAPGCSIPSLISRYFDTSYTILGSVQLALKLTLEWFRCI